VPDGTTLRTHLSSILNCDPMRITKKFTGDSCIGKRIFQPLSRCDVISDNGNNGNNGNNSTSSSSSSSSLSSSSSSSAPTYNSSSIVPGRADTYTEDSKEYQIAAEFADVSGNGGRQGSRQQQNTEGCEETRDNNTYSNNSSSGIGGEGNSSASVRNVAQDGLRNAPQDGPSLSAPYVSNGLKQHQQQVAEPTRKALESSDISNSSVTSSSDVNRNSNSAGVRTPNSAFIDNSRKELRLLRRTWLEKMLSAEREMARKNVKSSSSAKLNSGKIKVRKRLKRTVRK
jgi:hypothetical protein